jgi:phospholipase C
MARIDHFIVLLLENRSFDHLFGFATPPAGEKLDNLLTRVVKGTVEHRSLQHTSVIKPAREIFGLGEPLNRRDDSAQSFGDIFGKLDRPRTADEMPKTLNRARLDDTVESVVAGTAVHPADEPFNSLTQEWVTGMLALMGGGLESLEEAPTTQGEAKVQYGLG